MRTVSTPAKACLVVALSVALGGCGNSGDGGAGSGGKISGSTTAAGGAGGGDTGSSGGGGVAGGSSSSGGSSKGTSSAGSQASSGSSAVAGQTGGTSGVAGSSTGGQASTGSGGQAGRATGGSTQSGGATGGTGQVSSGGQGGRATGGSPGGATGGQASAGEQGGRATGGSGPAGGSATAGQTGGSVSTGGAAASCTQPANPQRLIAFGTTLDAAAQMCESQQLAKSVANPSGAQWRAKGDQHRTYKFPAANATVNYRIVVPSTWDGTSKLPLVMFLHSGFGNENTNLDENNGLLVKLASEHGYLLVSPLGYQGAYGNFLALPAVFGQPAAAAELIAAITPASERTNQLSEKDVINVLEIVLNEYPIDRKAMVLTGHSMGAGGTWYIGAKYPSYWTALATLSGPFVQESGYPWDNIRPMPNLITEGTDTAGTTGSRALRDYMLKNGFKVQFKEVVADHGGMIPLVLPDVFKFFDSNRGS